MISKSKIVSIHHFVVGVILLSKGYNKIQHHHDVIGWTILLLGIIIMAYFFLIKITQKKSSNFETTIHIFECIALLLTTYVYFQEGKSFLPYITLLASIGFFIATILHISRRKEHEEPKLK